MTLLAFGLVACGFEALPSTQTNDVATLEPTVGQTTATPAPLPTQPGTATRLVETVVPELRRERVWGDGVPVALALSPSETDLFVATTLSVQRRDARDLKTQIWYVPLEQPPSAMALSPDGAHVALALGNRVELRGADNGALRTNLRHNSAVQALAFAPDRTLLAVGVGSEAVIIWDVIQATAVGELRMHEIRDPMALPGTLTSLSFTPDGSHVATGDQNGNVVIWHLNSGQPLHNLSVGMRVISDLSFSPDGQVVAAASEGWRTEAGAVWLWDRTDGSLIERLTLDDGERLLEPVLRVAFSREGSSLVAGTAAGYLLRWTWPTGELEREAQGHGAAISALVLAAGGGMLSAGRDGVIRRWSGDGFVIDEHADLPAISAVAAGTDQFALGGEDGSLKLWNLTGTFVPSIPAHHGSVNALALSPDGRLLASVGNDGMVRLWNLPTGSLREAWAGHQGPVLAVAFNHNGTQLASAGWDGTLRLWSVTKGIPLRTLTVIEPDGLGATAVLAVSFQAHGTQVMGSAYNGEARRFDLSDGRPLPTMRTPSGGWLVALVHSTAGLSAALDDTGRLWSWDAEGSMLGRGALADATDVALLPDERLLTVGPTGGLRLWNMTDAGPRDQYGAPCHGDSLAVAPEGNVALVGSRRGFVELWELP
ncbi:hypothetical protein CJ255_09660 [Candidatus Viridilinea mediisalina]|uniref:Uncharacterized protein n=1 Tax=Candidatus Viridilinea mediisalina TaxID=2024553 RepID=A0A2A6RK54_9CHLR|nr:hypothetical protein CJ255_09660 [Candidatus Viridilinea mediisalina]